VFSASALGIGSLRTHSPCAGVFDAAAIIVATDKLKRES
jgi:hypothetical protein